jgi:hypothetical protein
MKIKTTFVAAMVASAMFAMVLPAGASTSHKSHKQTKHKTSSKNVWVVGRQRFVAVLGAHPRPERVRPLAYFDRPDRVAGLRIRLSDCPRHLWAGGKVRGN